MGLFRESAEHKAARLQRREDHKAEHAARLAKIDEKYGKKAAPQAANIERPVAMVPLAASADPALDAVKQWARNAEPATRLAATTASLDAVNNLLGGD